MDSQITIASAQETVILAYGTSQSPRRVLNWVFGGLIAGILVIGGGLWFGLRPNVPLPKGTVLTITVTPKTAKKILNAERQSQLPTVWQEAIRSDSSWPVILGMAQRDQSWEAFSISPRWISTTNSQTKRLVRYTRSTIPAENETRYTSKASEYFKHPTYQAHLDGDLSFALGESTSSQAFHARLKKNVLVTDIPFERKPTSVLTNGDLSLDLQNNAFAPLIMEAVRVLLFPQQDFPPIKDDYTTFSVTLDEANRLSSAHFGFFDALEKRQISLILAKLGLSQNNQMELPDGTYGTEKVEMSDFSLDQSSISFDIPKGKVVFKEKEMLFTTQATTDFPSPLSSCGNLKPVARISKKLMERVASIKNIPLLVSGSGLQLGEKNNQLVFCLED